LQLRALHFSRPSFFHELRTPAPPTGRSSTHKCWGRRTTATTIAIERFRQGATILFDGFAFGFRPGNEIACAMVSSAPIEQLDERRVREDAARARAAFESLKKSSPEFASSVAGKTFRVSLLSEFGVHSAELCRIIDDQIEWKIAR
jgi:hypothetical protein